MPWTWCRRLSKLATAGGWTPTWPAASRFRRWAPRPPPRPCDHDRAAAAVGAEVAALRAQLAALEPGPNPLGVHTARGVRALAAPRQRAPGAARGAAGD